MPQLTKTDVSEKRLYPQRRVLPHDPPPSVDATDAVFFITICCRKRGMNQLCDSEIASVLLNAAKFYHTHGRWFIHIMLLMPDHVHLLVSFRRDVAMRDTIAAWKRFTARGAGVQWQRDWFDHRLRADESFRVKADYILANPVRAELVASASDWPYGFTADQFDGRFGVTSLPG